MATDKLDLLLNEFIEAWNAGRRPRVDDFVERAPAEERDELAGLIGSFLELAPTPDYSPQQLAALERDPTVKAITKLLDSKAGLWPTLLPKLRGSAKLTRDQVVTRVAELLGLAGRERKIKRYYHQMESGTIDPRGVSSSVLDALAGVFGVDVDELEQAGDFPLLTPSAPQGAYLRSYSVQEVRSHREADVPPAAASPGDWDEVDELFRGGR